MKTRMKEYRAKNNLTQAQLAEKVGVRRETIVFLEKGKYNPSLKLAHDIAMILGGKIDDIFIF
jgi:putative transcriptional regulator